MDTRDDSYACGRHASSDAGKLSSLLPIGLLLPRRQGLAQAASQSGSGSGHCLVLLKGSAFDDAPTPRMVASKRPLARASGAMLMCLKMLLVLVGVCVLLEVSMLLLLGEGKLIFRRGRFHEHNSYQHGLLRPEQPLVPDAIVIVSMGDSFFNTESSVLSVLRACVCSQRHIGRYRGDILIVSDHADSLERSGAVAPYNVTFVRVEPVSSITRVWFMKCKLLEIVPAKYRTIMYMDSDIMATAPLDDLFASVPAFADGYIGMFNDVTTRFGMNLPYEKYHGGVVFMQRNASESCLAAWCDRMEGHPAPGARLPWGVGEVEDDQIAIAAAVDQERTCQVWFAPDRHMQFMADFTTMVLGPPATFSHFTNAARRRLRGPWRWFWRWVVFSGRRVGRECLAEAHDAYTVTPTKPAVAPATNQTLR